MGGIAEYSHSLGSGWLDVAIHDRQFSIVRRATRYRSCEKKRYGFYPVKGGKFIARGTNPSGGVRRSGNVLAS
jgi:hypothetical protein